MRAIERKNTVPPNHRTNRFRLTEVLHVNTATNEQPVLLVKRQSTSKNTKYKEKNSDLTIIRS